MKYHRYSNYPIKLLEIFLSFFSFVLIRKTLGKV